MDIEDLFKEQIDEEEKDFQLVLPELNPCSAENPDDIDSKKENKNKQCCNTKNLTCSELNCEEEKKGGLKEEEKKV